MLYATDGVENGGKMREKRERERDRKRPSLSTVIYHTISMRRARKIHIYIDFERRLDTSFQSQGSRNRTKKRTQPGPRRHSWLFVDIMPITGDLVEYTQASSH